MADQPLTYIPPPWSCKCETYWLVLTMRNPLPSGIYDPLTPSASKRERNFTGGLGMVQIVRYTETPVGPYDELLVIPGKFKSPSSGCGKGSEKLAITRIYVSQRQTLYNGRKNWNIPKQLARFEFSWPPVKAGNELPKALSVKVYPPDQPNTTPFFHATLTPWRWTPSFPLSTSWLPLESYLLQPPVGAGAKPELVGTNDWKGFQITASTKRARVTWVETEGEEPELVEGSRFWPTSKDMRPWSVGVWLEDATLEIPVPETFESASED